MAKKQKKKFKFFGNLNIIILPLSLASLLLTFFLFKITLDNLNKNQEILRKINQSNNTPVSSIKKTASPSPSTVLQKNTQTQTSSKNLDWTGPELFEKVNEYRKKFGVNPLGLNDDLCSIASARVHQLLDRGYNDGHKGFEEMYQNKDNSYYRYFEKYNISEFLVYSDEDPDDAVKQWENTLTHKTLLTGGQYTIGCSSAFSGIGVAIAGY